MVRTSLFFLFAFAFSLSQGGCIAFYSYYPANVTVRDAETEAPIPDAEVVVGYLYVMTLNAPKPDSAATDPQGRANLRAATFLQHWTVAADGYLYENKIAAEPADWARSGQHLDFRLYRAPAAHITVIVPTGYRGLLKVDKRPVAAGVQEEAGKRSFSYRATANGYVGIDATPLLLRLETFPISAAYEDGRSIAKADSRVGPSDIALRWVTCSDGHRDLYVIGTEQDVQAIRPVIYSYINGNPHHVSLNRKAFDALFDDHR